MVLVSAEVWTGQDGHFELAAGVPHRQPPPIVIGAKERPVVARAGVSGGTWLDIWVPAARRSRRLGVDARRADRPRRRAARFHRRHPPRRRRGVHRVARTTFSPSSPARSALALHNVQLDAALQASLDELQQRNDELQESRARIVAAGDAERRKLERNLHDGAQQHLVALAVKLRLARDAVEDDPDDAIAMIDEIKGDVQEAIPSCGRSPTGSSRRCSCRAGWPRRSRRPRHGHHCRPRSTPQASGRYGTDMEAAVYFCVLEAMQNAGKHAGESAHRDRAGVGAGRTRCGSRSSTTAAGSTLRGVGSPVTASSTWPTGSAPSAAR